MSGPRVAVDALALSIGGGVTWLRGLVPALADAWPEASIEVLVRAGATPPLPRHDRVRLARILAPVGAARMAAEWIGVPAWVATRRPDVLLAGADAGPVGVPCPMVQVVQNAKIYRERGMRYRLLRRAAKATASASKTTVFVSRAVRAVAEPVLEPDDSAVIPHGIEAPPERTFAAPVAWPYVLVVATPYEHKDLGVALAAVLEARRRGRPERLVLVGGGGDPRVVVRLREQAGTDPDALHVAGAEGGDDLEAWYAHASAVMLPSREESFGLSVAEAIARGKPVIASDAPALVETAAGHAAHHRIGDADGAAELLLRALEEPGDSRARLESARVYAQARTWRAAAKRYREVLARVP